MKDITQFNTPELEAAARQAALDNETKKETEAPSSDNFDRIKERVTKLETAWSEIKAKTAENRAYREIEVNVEDERQKGTLGPDETLIAIRVADDNINKKAAPYINYITTPQKTSIFRKQKGITDVVLADKLETFFTKCSRYLDWSIPFYQALDGMRAHGWTAFEVVVNKNNPGYFEVEYIPHDMLWFPPNTDYHYFNDANIIVRVMRLTKSRILKYADVNKVELDRVCKETSNSSDSDDTIEIHKVFYRKDDGTINRCILSLKNGKDFIVPPSPLFLLNYVVNEVPETDPITGEPLMTYDPLGMPMPKMKQVIEDVPEEDYPLFILPYDIAEEPKILSITGQIDKDKHLQEAATQLVSAIVNSWIKASKIFTSLAQNDPNGSGEGTVAEFKLSPQKLYSKPLEFFHMPFPDASGVMILQSLLTQNKAETNLVDFATNNREDSRKTAREISSAENQQALLNSVQVTLLASALTKVHTLCWKIVRRAIARDLIDITSETFTKQDVMEEYLLLPAGDSEVIQRAEVLNNLKSSWPIVAQTGAASLVLEDILRITFPANGARYVEALRAAGNNPLQTIKALAEILWAIRHEHSDTMSPDQIAQLDQLLAPILPEKYGNPSADNSTETSQLPQQPNSPEPVEPSQETA